MNSVTYARLFFSTLSTLVCVIGYGKKQKEIFLDYIQSTFPVRVKCSSSVVIKQSFAECAVLHLKGNKDLPMLCFGTWLRNTALPLLVCHLPVFEMFLLYR